MGKDFKQQFYDAMDKLEADAKAAGLNFTQICKETGISRATPDRWKKHLPKTVELVTRMQQVVAQKIREKETGIPGETA